MAVRRARVERRKADAEGEEANILNSSDFDRIAANSA